MSLSDKKLVQIAEAIRQQLQQLRIHHYGKLDEQMQVLADNLVRLQSNQRKLDICRFHAWNAAATKMTGNIEATLRDLPCLAERIERSVRATKTQTPSLRDVYEELVQAGEECEGLRYSVKDRSLS